MNYEKKPMVIEEKSMDIIDTALRTHSFSEAELPVVKRMIHSTGDVEYQEIIRFQHDFMTVASDAIRHGVRIYTDTRMIEAGINKRTLSKLGGEICCLVDTPEAFELAEKKGTTRSSVCIDLAVAKGVDVFVIGNAPTAIFRILELYREGLVKPKFIIGVPVGFVGAAESKEELRKYPIPQITTVGTKGGSNVASSVVNALLYSVTERC